ncbi:MAG: hypothetical protein JST40_11345 [Armatimonadetes bacterium]|nr:hypothetical protein [Armatimonadota bacterium]
MKIYRNIGILIAGLSACAMAAPWDQRLESRTSAGVLGNGQSDWPQCSNDGRYIAFTSLATNLTPALPSNGTRHVFRRDVLTGTTILIDFESTNMRAANGDAGLRCFICADGRYVVFDHDSPNVVAGDTNGVRDVFVRDTATNTTTRVSVNSAGVQGNAESIAGAISTDNRFVVFTSLATNLVGGDTNAVKDVFMRDLTGLATSRLSVNSAEVQGNGACGDYPWIGNSPNYVTFSTLATNLVGGDTNGLSDVFLRTGGAAAAGATRRLSVNSVGVEGNGASEAPVISNDNRYVAFHSTATNLIGADLNGALHDVFRKELSTGLVQIASITDGGAQEFGPSLWPSITGEGRCVAFHAYGQYEPADTNLVFDVYARNFTTNDTTLISRQSALGSVGNSSSYYCGISGNRKFVSFSSDANNLVPGDGNGVRDVFRYEYGPAAAIFALQLAFPGWDNPNDPQVEIEMRPTNGGDWVLFDPQPDPPGQFIMVISDFIKYDIYIRSPKFLQRVIRGVEFTPGGTLSFSRTLLGGDVDGDQSITIFDYVILSEYFDKSAADSDWRMVGANGFAPIDADVDGDGSVTIFDYEMVSRHFDMNGEF